jgi:hypothetical protein
VIKKSGTGRHPPPKQVFCPLVDCSLRSRPREALRSCPREAGDRGGAEDRGGLFFCSAFFYSKKLESFSLSEEASLFRGIGAMKRAMQMEELALTNA